ncbi:MAG TPA: NAD(P)-dependent oxidoreductase [Polyangiaceae bacterium]|jgi:nucleoside-diphosphate-sugar epimerase|nr:NAD(P)-dependent oxidoreductase [Polyangiaceae bacterium]
MTILLTGGSGFLGSHVAEQLSQAGRRVRVLVRKSSDTKFLSSLPEVELAYGAVDDRASVLEAARGVTGIVHAAGLVKARSADEFMRVNRGGTENLLEAAVENRSTLKRFVLVSSLAALRPSDVSGGAIPEDAEPRPVTSYGKSKLAAERAALSKKDQIPLTIVRPPAIYGPRDREILAFFKSIKLGVLPLLGPSQNRLSMIYGADCGAACIAVLDADKPSGTAYHIDDGAVHTMEELIMLTESAMAQRARLRIPLPRKVVETAAFGSELFGRLSGKAVMLTRDKCNELFEQWVCDGSRARRELGWEPKVSFEEGIRLTVDWYRKAGWL